MIGAKFSTGPGSCTPNTVAQPAPLEDGDDRAEGGEQRQHEPAGRDDRHEQRAEHHDHDQQRQPDHDAEVERQRVGELRRDVDVAAGLAGDAECRCRPPMRRQRRRRSSTSCSVETLDGPVGGHHLEGEERRASSETPTGRDGDDVVLRHELAGDLGLRRGRVVRRDARRRGSATTSSGPFWPAPNSSATIEYARYWVESAGSDEPSGRPRRIDSAGIGDDEQRRRSRPRARTTARQVRIGLTGAARRGRDARSARERAATSTRVPTRREQGGGERDGDQHRDEHADRADGAHDAEERDAGDVEREQCDEHRDPANSTALPDVPLASPIDSCSVHARRAAAVGAG